jgi:hypothetical protein
MTVIGLLTYKHKQFMQYPIILSILSLTVICNCFCSPSLNIAPQPKVWWRTRCTCARNGKYEQEKKSHTGKSASTTERVVCYHIFFEIWLSLVIHTPNRLGPCWLVGLVEQCKRRWPFIRELRVQSGEDTIYICTFIKPWVLVNVSLLLLNTQQIIYITAIWAFRPVVMLKRIGIYIYLYIYYWFGSHNM